ncbi:hypothetical protein DFH08DRAFT_1040179 [Mycena albidolilacea]|uniref:Uncharacterized protein n=1 Tax=Mycena albidolilacea TaxID=1033008 RepID=A0AAD7EFA5_9AGAR|nr:hypothetical protein DFH08DRAFT_1040179 [Mycena albidolilacea]
MKTAVKHMSSGNQEVFQKAWLERLIDPAVATIPRPTMRKVPEVGEEPAPNKVKPVVIVLDDSDTDSHRLLASLPAPALPSPMPHATSIPSTLSHTHTPIGNDLLVKLNDRQRFTKGVMALRYSISKLFILSFARERAHHIDKNTDPIVAAVNPGYCTTNMDHEGTETSIQRFLKRIVDYFIARTAEMGSQAIIHAAARQGGKE